MKSCQHNLQEHIREAVRIMMEQPWLVLREIDHVDDPMVNGLFL